MNGQEAQQPAQEAWNNLREEVEVKVTEARQELREIYQRLEHSRSESGRLAQRSTSVSGQLQQIQVADAERAVKEYQALVPAALEAQQRLFIMRGQVEKLQTESAAYERLIQLAEKILSVMSMQESSDVTSGQNAAVMETLEMLVQVQESERQRLSRQMHDGPAQALSNFILQTEIAMRLFDLDQEKARRELEDLKNTATSTFQKVRDFIFELRPMMLDDLGLTPTLKKYVEAFKEQWGVDVQLLVTGHDERLESYHEVMIFRAIQELLGNAVNRSQATGIKVQVDYGDAFVRTMVTDNGRGYDLSGLNQDHDLGIKVIRERVEMLGGKFDIDSMHGQGTRISFQTPVSK